MRHSKAYQFTVDPASAEDLQKLEWFKESVSGLGAVKCRGRGYKNLQAKADHYTEVKAESERRGFKYWVDIKLKNAKEWDVYFYLHQSYFRMRTREEFDRYYAEGPYEQQLEEISSKGELEVHPENESSMGPKEVNRVAKLLECKPDNMVEVVYQDWVGEHYNAWYFVVYDKLGLDQLLSALMFVELGGTNAIHHREEQT